MTKRQSDPEDCVIERSISWGKFTWIVGGLLLVISTLIGVGYTNTKDQIEKKLDRDVYSVEMKAHIEKNELQFEYIKNNLQVIAEAQKKIAQNAIIRYEKNESLSVVKKKNNK